MKPARALAAALAVLAAAGACDFDAAWDLYCEGTPGCRGPADAGSGYLPAPRSCGHTDDCGLAEICHPLGRVCIPTCRTDDDCPPAQGHCAELAGPGTGARVCQCLSAQSCALANPETTCSPLDNVCVRLCAGPADCAGYRPARTCDLASGLCLLEPARCSGNPDCRFALQPRCDLSVHRCSGCLSEEDCLHRPDGLTHCAATGACVAPDS